ncbi:MAG TPA: nicotinate-nucleotide adenylyltransferase [Pyrinomonadaceae bacterium]
MERLKRIALYGGSFDPVHAGHITVARRLLKLFALDSVLFIPAHVAPHKRETRVTPALQRYAMLVLATQGEAQLKVSSIEIDAPERPYTVDTLSRLQTELGREAQLFFIMGADSWMEITTWREWERVLSLANHIVVTRPGYEVSAAHVTPSIRERVIDLQGADEDRVKREVDRNDGLKIYITDAVRMDVSATAIRKLLREGDREAEIAGLVPPAVAEFIRKYRLYRDKHESELFN